VEEIWVNRFIPIHLIIGRGDLPFNILMLKVVGNDSRWDEEEHKEEES
jgi:hypothetical protein